MKYKQTLPLLIAITFSSVHTHAQTVKADTTAAKVAVVNPKIAELETLNRQYREALAKLEAQLPVLQQNAEQLNAEAGSSASENRDAARRLQSDVTDSRKARQAKSAAKQAAKDSDKAKEAESELADLKKQISNLKKKIENNDKKIAKLGTTTN